MLEGVGSQEIYSFKDGFSGHHEIKIVKEDHHKITFVTESGFFQYTVMPFGHKNALTIFSRILVDAFKDFIQKFLEVYMDDWSLVWDGKGSPHQSTIDVGAL